MFIIVIAFGMCLLPILLVLLVHLIHGLINVAFLATQGQRLKELIQESAPEIYLRVQVHGWGTPFGLTKENIELLRDPESNLEANILWQLGRYVAAAERFKTNAKWGGGAFFLLLLPWLIYVVLALVWSGY